MKPLVEVTLRGEITERMLKQDCGSLLLILSWKTIILIQKPAPSKLTGLPLPEGREVDEGLLCGKSLVTAWPTQELITLELGSSLIGPSLAQAGLEDLVFNYLANFSSLLEEESSITIHLCALPYM